MRSGSQCFHVRGVPTLQIDCPAGELIRVHSAFYGVKMSAMPQDDAVDDAEVCAYESGQNHCIQITELTTSCNGR